MTSLTLRAILVFATAVAFGFSTAATVQETRTASGSMAAADGPAADIAPASAGQADIAVLRLSSFDAVLADVQRIAELVGGEFGEKELLQPLDEAFEISDLSWLDRSEPIVVVYPTNSMMIGAKGVVAALPAVNPDAALASLAGAFDSSTRDDDGIHRFESSDKTEIFVNPRDNYLVFGLLRPTVSDFEPAAALNVTDLPAGNVALDVFLEPVAPLAMMGLQTGKQMVQQQVEAEIRPGDTEEGGSEEAPRAFDPRSVTALTDLYFRMFEDLLNNASRLQFSFEIGTEHLIPHIRVVPRAGSTLAGLLQAQKGGLSETAGYIQPSDDFMIYTGQIRYTGSFLDAMSSFLADYGKAIAGVADVIEQAGENTGTAAAMRLATRDMTGWLDCYSGNFSGSFSMSPESGIRSSQVHGVNEPEACRALMSNFAVALRDLPSGPAGERMFEMTENALSYGGVNAFRYVMNAPEPEDASGASMWSAWFGGQQGMVTLSGVTDHLVITTAGAEAESAFKALVDRSAANNRAGGIREEHFAPLSVGPGFFGAVDLATAMNLGAEEGPSEAATAEALRNLSDEARRAVWGARLDTQALNIEWAVSLGFLEAMMKLDAEEEAHRKSAAEHEITPGAGEHREPPAAVPGGPKLAGVGDVTNPRIIPASKTNPVYPAEAREARLEGNCAAQAIVRRDGSTTDEQILRCSRSGIGFEEATLNAIRRWRYEPATEHGEPVDVYFTIFVKYELD